jgi:hypothetical protein
VTALPVRRRARRALALGGAVVAAVALAYGVSIAQAADQRLDDADAALEKAAALLEASESGPVSEKQQKRFERAVAKAIAHVEDARAQIVQAKDAVDNP